MQAVKSRKRKDIGERDPAGVRYHQRLGRLMQLNNRIAELERCPMTTRRPIDPELAARET
jgi:hypothetical protein